MANVPGFEPQSDNEVNDAFRRCRNVAEFAIRTNNSERTFISPIGRNIFKGDFLAASAVCSILDIPALKIEQAVFVTEDSPRRITRYRKSLGDLFLSVTSVRGTEQLHLQVHMATYSSLKRTAREVLSNSPYMFLPSEERRDAFALLGQGRSISVLGVVRVQEDSDQMEEDPDEGIPQGRLHRVFKDETEDEENP